MNAATLESFREHLERTESPRTVAAYLADAEEFGVYTAGRPVSMDVLEGWTGSLNDGRLKPQTIQRKMAGVRRWLAFLARHGDTGAIATLAVLGGGYQVIRGPRQADMRRVEPVTEEEYRLAMGHVAPWGRHLTSLLWWTGVRISKVVGDSVAGIPWLSLRQGAELVRQGHSVTVGKGGKVRTIVLPSAGRVELAAWVEGRTSDAPLFGSPTGPSQAVTAQGVNAMLRRAGLRKSCHAFRHSFKVRLRRAGVAEEVIRALLGHGPRSITDAYGQVSVVEMLAAVERLVIREA